MILVEKRLRVAKGDTENSRRWPAQLLRQGCTQKPNAEIAQLQLVVMVGENGDSGASIVSARNAGDSPSGDVTLRGPGQRRIWKTQLSQRKTRLQLQVALGLHQARAQGPSK